MPADQATESFRDIPGWPHYRISHMGRIQTRKHGKWITDHWKDMKPFVNNIGYLIIDLNGPQGRRKFLVHRLVLEAFIGPCPEGMIARHVNDNNRKNCRLDNLCWGTYAENQADRIVHGTEIRGSKHYKAKITEDDAREIRRLRAMGWSGVKVARFFGVTQKLVSRIYRRETWKHIV